jgi:glycosyltransferase involved in cell wall biosynthesis
MPNLPKPSHRLLAVIPAFNEQGRIAAVVRGLHQQSLRTLVVDDGSKDLTADEARAAGATVISQPNGGKGKAILSGCAYAIEHGYRAVVLLDGDGQHDPREAMPLIRAWLAGADLVIGKRVLAIADQPTHRRLLNRLSSLLVTLAAGQHVRDSQSGFRVCDPRLLLRMPFSGCRYDLETEMCVFAARLNGRIREVPITAIYNDKTSGVHPVYDTARFFRAIFRSIVAIPRLDAARQVGNDRIAFPA